MAKESKVALGQQADNSDYINSQQTFNDWGEFRNKRLESLFTEMTEVENSVGCLRLLLAVATTAHIAFIFSVAILLVSEIATIGSLLMVKHPFIILH